MRAWNYVVAIAVGYGCSRGVAGSGMPTKEAPASEAVPTGVNVEDIHWRPSALYPGVQVGDLEGGNDPGPYTLRGRFPDGAVERPHWHPNLGHVTVLSGVVHFGLGEHFDSAATTAYRAGAFFIVPPRTPHFLWMEGTTEIQNHGYGPYEVVFVDPADDPRRR
jgi:quercetin dioxygenase-like cupin family protein